MAGKLTVSTLNNDTGVLATQNGMTGIAKAWCNYNAGTATIVGSFNISSVTVIGTGQYVFNFTTAMPNANYSANVVQGWSGYNNGGQSQLNSSACTSSAVAVGLLNYTGASYVSPVIVAVQVFSS